MAEFTAAALWLLWWRKIRGGDVAADLVAGDKASAGEGARAGTVGEK